MKKLSFFHQTDMSEICLKQTLRIMKLTSFFIFAVIFNLFGGGLNTKKDKTPLVIEETKNADLLQQITVTGTVSDAQRQALPGVNILLKGTLTGTITDVQGGIR